MTCVSKLLNGIFFLIHPLSIFIINEGQKHNTYETKLMRLELIIISPVKIVFHKKKTKKVKINIVMSSNGIKDENGEKLVNILN